MARMHYRYNSETCKYEPLIVSPRLAGRKVLRFLGISLLIGIAGLAYVNCKFPLLDETQEVNKNQKLKAEWQVLYKQLERTSNDLVVLETNDDHNYRVILDLDPLEQSQREAGVGGRERVSAGISLPLIKMAYLKADKIQNRLDIESQSFQQLMNEVLRKEKMWASRPAIQPVSNKDLTHLHTLFGLRMHPIHGYVRPHNGLDFTAPTGSPVYATGDGKVTHAEYSPSYGNVVYVNHGYGFETRYAHMTRYIVAAGQEVKRGQIIGYVGNTGDSVGPHLHYEVHYKNQPINPVNFFQRDLNNKEYEKLIELGSRASSSLD